MVKLLLDHKADTSLLYNGHSPLSLAIVSGNDNVSHASFSYLYYLLIPINQSINQSR